MSAAPPLLFLSEAEVTAALSMREAIATNRAAFAALARGDCVVPSRLHIATPENQGVTLFKPALSGDALGCKIVSVRPNNAELGLPTVPSVMILVDKTTAMPRAVMGGVQLTGLRTAAGSGAATASMAREDVARLVVFGAGLQGREHVKAMLEVRPSLKHVVVVNRSEPRAAALVRQLGESFDGVEFEVVLTADQEGVETAVRAADIICTGTNASEPLFDGKLVPKGCHINCVGSYKPNMQEIDEELVARCTTIAVDCAGAKASSGDLAVPIASGRVQADDMLELGSVFVQEDEGTPFKRGADDITLFKSVGVGIQDILTADKVVSAAQARGLGTTLSL